MPAIRSPLRPAIRSPLRSPLAPALGGSPSLTAQVQALFASRNGGMWDFGDTATLFQDTAGATPVTAVTQPIGRVNDKSGNGNHATQPTAGSRPLFSALKNLLVKTEQLDDGGPDSGIWKRSYGDVVVTPNQGSGGFSDLDRIENSVGSGEDEGLYQATAVAAANKTFTAQVTLAAVSGTTTAVLFIWAYGDVGNSAVVSLTTTPTTFTVSHTFGAGAVGNCYLEIAPNVVGVPILAGRAQLEYGAIATSYQRVNTDSDYDTVGFPAFAQFDATDDALLFPAITFGGAFNTFVAGKVTGSSGLHLWRTADSPNGYWAAYASGDVGSPTPPVSGVGSPSYAINGVALSPSTRGELYSRINGVDSVTETTGIVLSAETALQMAGYSGFQFQGNAHRVLMISGTLTAAEKLLCRQWCAEGNGVAVV